MSLRSGSDPGPVWSSGPVPVGLVPVGPVPVGPVPVGPVLVGPVPVRSVFGGMGGAFDFLSFHFRLYLCFRCFPTFS